jgi:hypothetical protein
MESLYIQAFTYEPRHDLVGQLTAAFANCGGWVIERKTLSPVSLAFLIEIQLRSVLDLYAAIVGTGVELTRAGHDAFTELCLRLRHMRMMAELGKVVSIRLEITFLDDLTVHSLLASGSGVA